MSKAKSKSKASTVAKYFNGALRGEVSSWPIGTINHQEEKQQSGFSPFVAFCFAINYVLGTGFLTVPWAFVQGGVALSSIILVVVCIISDIAKDYILETMARAEAMLDHDQMYLNDATRELGIDDCSDDGELGNMNKLSLCSLTEATKNTASAESQLQGIQYSRKNYNSISTCKTTTKSELFTVKDRKFEMNTLCLIFLGEKGLNLYTLFLAMYIYGALWAFTAVFSSAMASALPIFDYVGGEDANYTFYAIIYGLIVVPLTCLELNEQIVAQVLLTLCRFLIIFFMVETSTYCAATTAHYEEEPSLLRAPQQYSGDGDSSGIAQSVLLSSSTSLFHPAGLHKMLPVLLFSNIYHYGIPAISHHVADKTKLGPIFRSTCVFIAVSFLLIGIILGSTFGENVEQSVNLNWKKFFGKNGENVDWGGEDGNGAPLWMIAISLFIVCFPALDVISAFPLNAITLGNNMMSAFYGLEIHEAEKNRWVVIIFRLLASIPPIILGIFVRELGIITDYAGTTGFVITFSFPALLHIKSKMHAKSRQLPTTTYYTTYASSDWVAYIIFIFGIAMVVFVLFEVLIVR